MNAWVNGIMIQGSPEEIERYRQITAEKKTHAKLFNVEIDFVPEHVKRYGENNKTYLSHNTTTIWY